MTAPVVYGVDASVAAQVVSPEPLTAQATALFALLTNGQATFQFRSYFISSVPISFGRKSNEEFVPPAKPCKR